MKPIFLGGTSTIALVTGVSVYKAYSSKLTEKVKSEFNVLFTKVAELQKQISDIQKDIKKSSKAFEEEKNAVIEQMLDAKRVEIIQKIKAGERPSIISPRGKEIFFEIINNARTGNQDQIRGWINSGFKDYVKKLVVAELE